MKGRRFVLVICFFAVAIFSCLAFCDLEKGEAFASGALVKIVYVGESDNLDSSKVEGSLYNPYDTIQDAINLESGSAIKICLVSDLVIDGTIKIDEKTVTVDGGDYNLSYAESFTNTMFEVGESGRLIVTNVQIDGGNNWTKNQENLNLAIERSENGELAFDETKPIIERSENGKILSDPMFVNRGTLSILAGTVIQNCYFSGSLSESGNRLVYSIGSSAKLAELIVENVMVSHCVSDGGLFYMSYTDFLIGGASYIVDNFSNGGKVGVLSIENNSVAMMKSGVVIKNNFGFADSAMAIYVDGGSEFVLNGGVIRGNRSLKTLSSSMCATITLVDANFVMNDGIIAENIGQGVSAISFLPSTSEFKATFNLGEISENVSYDGLKSEDGQTVDLLTRGETLFGKEFSICGNVVVDASCKIENKGVIIGDLAMSSAEAVFENIGKIIGNVGLEFGRLVNSGKVVGEIELLGGSFENNNVLDGRVVASVGEDGKMLGEVLGFCESVVVFENVVGWVDEGFVLVTFDFNGGIDSENFIRRRVLVEAGSLPVFEFSVPLIDGKVFYGFNGEIVKADRDVTYFAIFEEDRNLNGLADVDEPRLSVTYSDGVDGEEVFADQVYSGILSGDAAPKFEGIPTRVGFQFWGWDKKVDESVTENVTYVAVWIEVEAESSVASIILIVLQILGLVLAFVPVGYVLFQKYRLAFINKHQGEDEQGCKKQNDKNEIGSKEDNKKLKSKDEIGKPERMKTGKDGDEKPFKPNNKSKGVKSGNH